MRLVVLSSTQNVLTNLVIFLQHLFKAKNVVKILLRWFKKKCLNDQKGRFSEYSLVNHLNSPFKIWFAGSDYTLNIDFGDGSEVVTIYNNGTAEIHTVEHIFLLPGDLNIVVTANNGVTDPAIQNTANIDVQVEYLRRISHCL